MASVIDRKEILELSGYFRSMSKRLQNLQRTSSDISRHIDSFMENTHVKKRYLESELTSIKKDLSGLREEVRSIQKAILNIIEGLKGSVKVEDLKRFKKRLDVWSPETLVTRREVEKALNQM